MKSASVIITDLSISFLNKGFSKIFNNKCNCSSTHVSLIYCKTGFFGFLMLI